MYNIGIIFDILTDFTTEDIEEGLGAQFKDQVYKFERVIKAVLQPEGPPTYQALHSVKVFSKGPLPEFITIFTL